jgi:preprotein translocase subunit Sec61beta
MVSKKSGRGLSSSAGLVTYYDADSRTAVHIDPKPVLIAAAIVGAAVYLLNLLF